MEVEIEALTENGYTDTPPHPIMNDDEEFSPGETTSSEARTPTYPMENDDNVSARNPNTALEHIIMQSTRTHTICLRGMQSNLGTNIDIQPTMQLTPTEKQDLLFYETSFGSKEFMLLQSEGIPAQITEKPYNVEAECQKKYEKGAN